MDSELPDLIAFLLNRPVAFHPILAVICDSVSAGLFLSQALYWSRRTNDLSGWFYKTRDEWCAEVGLTRYEQEGARDVLRESGFIDEDLRGVPAKVHYRVNEPVIINAILQWWKKYCQLVENQPTDGGKPTNSVDENQPTLPPETTQETTSHTGDEKLNRIRSKAAAKAIKKELERKARMQGCFAGQKAARDMKPNLGAIIIKGESNNESTTARRARESDEQIKRVLATLPTRGR